ncbi:hypothetical protein AAVH_20259 [Aphelenchoides avenae]|nr:hypothetical protein AAVH_20259 [Aphelenchus avenae]
MIKHTAKDPQEERTARPEQMREGFGQTTGHERRGPTPSEQSDPIDDDNLQEIRLRLDHLESLLMKLPERIGLAEYELCKAATAESGKKLDQLSLRLNRIESLLSQPSNDAERTTTSIPHDKRSQTGGAAEPEKPLSQTDIILASLVIVGLCAWLAYDTAKDKKIRAAKAATEEAEKRRQLVEAVADRLAVEFRVASRLQRRQRRTESEDEDTVSFENLELFENEASS